MKSEFIVTNIFFNVQILIYNKYVCVEYIEIDKFVFFVIDYTLRRRRPMTLRIGPRLSLPNKSTSAPTTTTDGDWPALG